MSGDLEPLSPTKGVEMYMEGRQDELTDKTLTGHKYRLKAFLQWCDEENIGELNTITGRDLYEYRIWRREGHGEGRDAVKPVTLSGQLATIRAFLGFCAEIDAVPEGLREKVPLPTLSSGQDVSQSTLEPDRAIEIVEYLERYQFASRTHVIVLLLWHTGCRISGLQALDLDDLDLGEDEPGIEFVHRPETDTQLKNDEKSERWNAISSFVSAVVEDYVDGPRKQAQDDHGRDPLITTQHGRACESTIRNTLYRVTRPCWRGETCPHDRDPNACEATEGGQYSTCPSARSPHDVRSGRVTAYRRDNVPRAIVSDRLNASGQVLDKHYDRRGKRERAEQRRDHLPDS